jgi:hypothetical protein
VRLAFPPLGRRGFEAGYTNSDCPYISCTLNTPALLHPRHTPPLLFKMSGFFSRYGHWMLPHPDVQPAPPGVPYGAPYGPPPYGPPGLPSMSGAGLTETMYIPSRQRGSAMPLADLGIMPHELTDIKAFVIRHWWMPLCDSFGLAQTAYFGRQMSDMGVSGHHDSKVANILGALVSRPNSTWIGVLTTSDRSRSVSSS